MTGACKHQERRDRDHTAVSVGSVKLDALAEFRAANGPAKAQADEWRAARRSGTAVMPVELLPEKVWEYATNPGLYARQEQEIIDAVDKAVANASR